ncbi:diacylglycerol kinase family protein [Pseudonocardia acaciae]|uniref:diacylglycerol kinase family protein n=1 Tax=Pseudonocardia acaciae TaxID=551276 RepID=UPI00048E214E|nr:diacylglycerol kinase family protein [Pseudonocardia acaciae]
MTILALRCSSWPGGELPVPDDVVVRELAGRPERADVDPLLAELAPDRVVVAGTDGDLAAVVLRLLRTERLASVAVAYLPASADSAVAATWGLPTDPTQAVTLALHGEPDRVPLIRDDAGGILLGRGEVRPARGVVYCDDELVLRGQANRLEVTPIAPVGVDVRAVRVGLLGRKVRAATGRAVQIGCLPATVLHDGAPHPRPVTRWTWYKHTEDLRLVRGQP